MKPGVYVTHSLVLNESWCMSRPRWLWCMSRIPWSWMSSGVCHALFGLGWVLVYVTHSLVLNESQCMSRPRWSWMSSGVCHAFLGLEWVLVYVMDESWKMSHIPWSCNLKVSNLRAVTVNPKLERVTQLSSHGVYKLSLTELERVTQLPAHGVHNVSWTGPWCAQWILNRTWEPEILNPKS